MNLTTVLICMMFAGSCSTTAREASDNPLAQVDIRTMNSSAQIALLREVFGRRLAHATNISYTSQVVCSSYRLNGDEIGPLVQKGWRLVNKHWRLGGSYRMDSEFYLSYGDEEAASRSQAGFDEAEGVATMVGLTLGDPFYGRISTRQDQFIDNNRYAYWLDGDGPEHGDAEFLVRYTLQHLDEAVIAQSDDEPLVKLTVPWKPLFSRDRALGVRHLWLDPAKGFLPVKGHARWDLADGSDFRSEEFVVEGSQVVADVWMPTRLKEFIRVGHVNKNPAAAHLKNTVGVYETSVLTIEHGNVTPEDLVIEFPTGTKVLDEIEGLSYTVGEDGNPTGPLLPVLVGTTLTRPMPEASSKPHTARRAWLATANLVLLVGAVLWYVSYRRRFAR